MKQYAFNTREQLEKQLSKLDGIEVGEKLKSLMSRKGRLEGALRVEKRLILKIDGGVAYIGRVMETGSEMVYLYN